MMRNFLTKLWHYPPIPLPLYYKRVVYGPPGQGTRTLTLKLLRDREAVGLVKKIKKMSITDFLDGFFNNCVVDDMPGNVEKIFSTDYFFYWSQYYPRIYRIMSVFEREED